MTSNDENTIKPGQKVVMRDTKLPEAHGACACECHRSPGVMHSWVCCRKPDNQPQGRVNRNPQAG